MSKFGTKEDAKKQMAAMGLTAPYIGSKETRTEEEIKEDRKTLAENVPILGEAMLAKEIASDVKDENYLSAGLNTAALAVGVIPGVGKVASRPIRTIAKSMRKGYNPEDPASRVFHLTKKDFDTADVIGKGTNDIGFHVGTSAQANARGSTGFNYDRELAEKMVAEERVLPLVLKEKLKPARIPDMSSFKSPQNWIGNLSVAKSDRTRIKFLLGEKADADLLSKAPRVTVGGDTYYMLPDVMREGMDPKLWEDLILEADRAKRIGLDTISKQEDRIAWFSTLKHTANKNGYDSFVYKNEYEGVSGDTLLNNDSYMLLEADQAKGLFGKMTEGSPEFMKNKGGLMLQNGGAVPMNNMAQQMELFEPAKNSFNAGGLQETGSPSEQLLIDFNSIAQDYNESRNISGTKSAVSGAEMMAVFDSFVGSKVKLKPVGMQEGGLLDEGGTVDPVSGNDVPPGSNQEEVRDDIPAQLSEGEFVFPADVVRFIGLEKLMMIRQRAKAGLKMMEDMGQMGNSEEAIMPDDLPFSVEDLDMEDDGLEMAQGGVVNAANGTFVQPTSTNPNAGVFYNPAGGSTTGVATAPVQAASATRSQPVQANVPVVDVNAPKETFENYIGQNIPGVNFKYVTYIDENGNKIQLRQSLTSDEMLDPVPEGYKLFDAEKAKVDTATSETTRVQSTTDAGDGGNDNESPGPGSTDVTGIGYDRSKVTEPLADVLSKYGAGFGTLADTFVRGPRNALKGAVSSLGVPGMKPTALSNALTSAGLGGVLDNFRQVKGGVFNYDLSDRTFQGGSRRSNKAYGDTDSLDNMSIERQNVIAGVANVVMPEIQSLFQNDKGKALSSAEARENMEKALSDLGLSASQISNIATRGGNFNQNDKLARALGNLKVEDIITGPRFDDIIASVSPEAAAAIKDGNTSRNEGILGRQITRSDVFDARRLAADARSKEEESGFNKEDPSGYGDSSVSGGGDRSSDDATSDGIGVDDQGFSTGYGSEEDCLTEDMKVKLNGVIDFVTNIKVGDMIDNYKVKEVLHKHMRSGYYAINNELKISNDHPVLANGTWTRPEDLVVGDSINGIPLSSLEYVEQLTPTVSIVIDGESFDVHTENNIYTVHGRYREVRQEAA